MTKLPVKGTIFIEMALCKNSSILLMFFLGILETGNRINKTGMVKKFGRMAVFMKGIIKTA